MKYEILRYKSFFLLRNKPCRNTVGKVRVRVSKNTVGKYVRIAFFFLLFLCFYLFISFFRSFLL